MRSAFAHIFGLGRHLDGERRAAFARRALEGLGGGVKIARAVIDDGDVHDGSRLREEPDDLFALSATSRTAALLAVARPLHGALDPLRRPRLLSLLRQPGSKNESSASVRSRPLGHAHQPVAVPLERGAAEIVGLEGEQRAE